MRVDPTVRLIPNNQPYPIDNKDLFLADPASERYKKGFRDEQKAHGRPLLKL
jgi:hypothetical protein